MQGRDVPYPTAENRNTQTRKAATTNEDIEVACARPQVEEVTEDNSRMRDLFEEQDHEQQLQLTPVENGQLPSIMSPSGRTSTVYRESQDNADLLLSLIRSEAELQEKENGPAVDKDTLIFVGESSPLSFLERRLQESGHVSMSRLSHPLKESFEKSSVSTSSSVDSVASSLSQDSLRELLAAYFSVIRPFYPVISRQWFSDRYFRDDIPPLLLSAMCFAACYHCSIPTNFQTGYASREKAKEVFYLEAKRLFDEDQEEDILVVLQSVILLSFYGGKTRRVWNSRTWLGVAITLAEEMGIHRSTSRLKMDESDKCHLKVIWWTIVFRDFFTSINYRRPPKTHDPTLIRMLTIKEFLWDKDPSDPIFGQRDMTTCHFLVEYAKLNMLMSKVIQTRHSAYSDVRQSTLEQLYNELTEWLQNLPECLDWKVNRNNDAALYTCMGFHHMTMLIYRPRSTDPDFIDNKRAVQSASEIATIVGNFGIQGTHWIPQDMYQIITTAVAILLNEVQKNDSSVAKLQLQICFMTLNQAKENWDHAPWIVKFFEHMQKKQPDQTISPEFCAEELDFLDFPIEDL
ncbi:hypothetical protein TRICI_000885 [Trichomonascus ciferrii]|uniref:Xylanolytic transcriptional activator regulatory domain-containing protein n=1 Tax=Trichomonascus ciferrii TaxID=44093 RepID=A0A642VAQ1_9ASCO|nr:hypothetical protein TRICI_000885 [Trichomonascus ciferrii]